MWSFVSLRECFLTVGSSGEGGQLHIHIRPVKARDQSDGALPLWCMPPCFSPVIHRWCTITGGQRASQCSPDVCVYMRVCCALEDHGSSPTSNFGYSTYADFSSCNMLLPRDQSAFKKLYRTTAS